MKLIKIEDEILLDKVKNIIYQDDIEVAFDIFRILKGLESKRLENVISYLKNMADSNLVVDFDKSTEQLEIPNTIISIQEQEE